ncbi:hypothetical protein diail_357 [Diaporthe ilicicola]|nr:hypothetical protein diail_357 [Diaporthe ilicicola]
MSPHKRRSGSRPEAFSHVGRVVDAPPTQSPEGNNKPQRVKNDWRPAFNDKFEGLLYSFGASWSLPGDPSGARMGEAYHDNTTGVKGMMHTTRVGKGYCMKAMSPGADFDASSTEAARKKRVETLRDTIRWSETELDSVIKQEDGTRISTQPREKPREECLNELFLLRNYVVPRREVGQRAREMVQSFKKSTLPAPPVHSPLPSRTNAEIPNRPGPVMPEGISSITAADVWNVLRTGGEWPLPGNNMVDDEADYSNSSTILSTSNADVWRSESEYDDSPDEEQGDEGEEEDDEEDDRRRRSPPLGSASTLPELKLWSDAGKCEDEDWERRDSGLAGMDKTEADLTGDKGDAKSLVSDGSTSPSTLLDFFPAPFGDRLALPKGFAPRSEDDSQTETEQQGVHTDHTQRERARPEKSILKTRGRQETAQQQQLVQDEPVSESVVLEPAQYTAPPTCAEKGKWVAECTCPRCRPQDIDKRVRFDEAAMDKAEQEPGLSCEEFVKLMRENRRRMEAEQRGEGCSSWSTTPPQPTTTRTTTMTGLGVLARLDGPMFTNLRPAPPVPLSVDAVLRDMAAKEGRTRMRGLEVQQTGRRMEQNKPGKDKYSIFPPIPSERGHTFAAVSMPRASSGTGNKAIPRSRAPRPMTAPKDGRRRQLWKTLSGPFKR